VVAQLGDDEIVQDTAVGAAGAAQGEEVRAEPVGQDRDLVGQGDGRRLLELGVRQLVEDVVDGAEGHMAAAAVVQVVADAALATAAIGSRETTFMRSHFLVTGR